MTDRLSVVDDIFLRTHRGFGTPIALQGLWRTAERVEPALLAAVHTALRTGPLGRRVVRPAVPGARRRWRASTRAHPPARADGVLPVADLLDWADTTAADLDPEHGPGWRLSAADLDDGGTVISLTCSHALADGRALVIAADEALRSLGRTAPIPGPPPTSDWADARHQWSTVLRGTVRALRQGIPYNPERPPTRRATAAARPTGVVLQCQAVAWESAAAPGTANSLFLWIVAQTLWAAGHPRVPIEASLPVDTRAEPRVDNDLAMTRADISPDDTPVTLREKARAAYEHRMTSPGGMPEELLQVIPDRWAAALSAGAGERDILCSNIGPLPDSIATLGPHRCTGVAARAIHPGLTTLPRTRLSGYLCRTGPDHILSLVGLDPDLFPTSTALRTAAETALAPLALPVRWW
ncbi:hypothetical protein ACWEKT_19505 [Nocardia takedensis]